MPERSLEALTEQDISRARRYEVGYDWIPGRFGPPPGIPRARKDQLDAMSDRDYLFAFMKLSQEEKESLMISETERRRTFAAHWPIWNFISGYDCAKEGFYYTGVSDRVQCAFCGGVIRNWERGDIPKQSHKNYFSYCKMVQGKPCHNIPYDPNEIKSDVVSDKLSTLRTVDSASAAGLSMSDLGILESQAKHSQYRVSANRMKSYDSYSWSHVMPSADLCAAGFFFEGHGDKVRCFWCSGSLELWTEQDDPWLEHAKWYPGCLFVRAMKGVDYIKAARAKMSEEDMKTSSTLQYNHGDLSFLFEQVKAAPLNIEDLDTYSVCRNLGYPELLIRKAFELNNGQDFREVSQLINVIDSLENGDDVVIDDSIGPADSSRSSEEACAASQSHRVSGSTVRLSTPSMINVESMLKAPADPSDEESFVIVAATTCHVCNKNEVGAVLLPCGHFCVCQNCSRTNLPRKCPQCGKSVRGACRALC